MGSEAGLLLASAKESGIATATLRYGKSSGRGDGDGDDDSSDKYDEDDTAATTTPAPNTQNGGAPSTSPATTGGSKGFSPSPPQAGATPSPPPPAPSSTFQQPPVSVAADVKSAGGKGQDRPALVWLCIIPIALAFVALAAWLRRRSRMGKEADQRVHKLPAPLPNPPGYNPMMSPTGEQGPPLEKTRFHPEPQTS